MKKTIIALLALLTISSAAVAADSIAFGVRAGGEIGSNNQIDRNTEFYEGFGDLYLNRLVSIGATLAYSAADHKSFGSIRRDESYPLTALFKVHVPIPFFQPYAGLGQAFILHNHRSSTGSPVAFAGADISPLPIPLFLNIEYRHQFNGGDLDFLAGGVGVKF
ncbi:MAG: outer membrane beta-barrel protein [Geobacteraceae bacterium]|nr:outer membrane beta-barrel protein [Geobacteraceae bacterium]